MRQKNIRTFQQSGVVPYRVRDGKVEVLLVTNSRRQHWVIPKGGIAKGMTASDSAAKEAWEEAGVIGQVVTNKNGSYKYRKRGVTYRVEVFLLSVKEVLSDWPEASRRKRQWLAVAEAIKRVEPSELKQVLEAMTKLSSTQAGSNQTEPLVRQDTHSLSAVIRALWFKALALLKSVPVIYLKSK